MADWLASKSITLKSDGGIEMGTSKENNNTSYTSSTNTHSEIKTTSLGM